MTTLSGKKRRRTDAPDDEDDNNNFNREPAKKRHKISSKINKENIPQQIKKDMNRYHKYLKSSHHIYLVSWV